MKARLELACGSLSVRFVTVGQDVPRISSTGAPVHHSGSAPMHQRAQNPRVETNKGYIGGRQR